MGGLVFVLRPHQVLVTGCAGGGHVCGSKLAQEPKAIHNIFLVLENLVDERMEQA